MNQQNFRLCIRAFLVTTSLWALTSQSTTAFTLKPKNGGATRYYQGSGTYTYISPSGVEYLGITDLLKIEKRTLGGTKGLLNLLDPYTDPRWMGWNFISSKKPLPGTLEVLDYMACVYNIPCGKPGTTGRAKTGVGAYINIKFTRPSPTQQNSGTLYWLQRVVNNHAQFFQGNPNLTHGIKADTLDIPPWQNVNPFYAGDSSPPLLWIDLIDSIPIKAITGMLNFTQL